MKSDELRAACRIQWEYLLPYMKMAKVAKKKPLTDDKTKYQELRRALKFYKKMQVVFKEVQVAYDLVEPKTWAYYERMGLKKMQEQVALEVACVEAKRAWTTGYREYRGATKPNSSA